MSNPRVIETDLATVLGAIAASGIGRAKGDAPKRTIAQDIETLKAAAVRYSGPTAFKPGDLVTPRADSPLENAGRPHIVLEAPEYPGREFVAMDPKHVDSPRYGAKLDIRVASTCNCGHGEVRAYWEESWMFEPYAETAVAPEAPSEAV